MLLSSFLPELNTNLTMTTPQEEAPREAPAQATAAQKKHLQDSIFAANDALTKVDLTPEALGPWSFSKYKTLKKCPFQFFLKYVLKIKVPETLVIQDDPLSSLVGKAAHLILEESMKGKTLEKSFAIAKKQYVLIEKSMTEEQWEERIVPLTFNINSFKERIETFSRLTPIKRVLTEIRVGMTKDWEPTGFFSDDVFIRGVIDLVLMLECADALVIDHKHGGGEGAGIKNYQEQLDWYKVMVHRGIQKVGGVQVGINFIKMGDIRMGEFTPSSDIEGNLTNSIEMSIEGAIDILKETGYFKHIRGGPCKWCEYDHLGCKDGTLKPMELGTKKWIKISTT